MKIRDIINLFEEEFASLKERFEVNDLSLDKAEDTTIGVLDNPGVYVFWKDDKVIKVGRHLRTARKRALQHVKDNTGGKMKKLEGDPDAHLLLFNVKNFDDRHWVAALEIFLELRLKPEIRSNRLG